MRGIGLIRSALLAVVFGLFNLTLGHALAQEKDPCADLLRRFSAGGVNAKPAAEMDESAARVEANSRSCLLSFPWPKDVDPHKALQDASSDEASRIRDNVYSLENKYTQFASNLPDPTKSKLKEVINADEGGRSRVIVALLKAGLDGQNAKYAAMRLAGGTPEQTRLWADMFYVRRLFEEGQFKKIKEVGESLRAAGRLSIAPHALDRVEQSTYFSEQALRNMIGAFDLIAQKHLLAPDDPVATLDVVAQYLEAQTSFKDIQEMVSDEIVPASFLSTIKSEWILDPDTSHLARSRFYCGTATDDGGRTLFMRGTRDQYFAIEFSHAGGPELLSPDAAVTRMRNYSNKVMASNSTSKMQLFNVINDSDRFIVDLPDGRTVQVTKDAIASHSTGRNLDPQGLLDSFLTNGDAAKVLFSNPLMHSPGPELTATKDFLFHLQQAYPSIQLFLDPLSSGTAERAQAVKTLAARNGSDVVVIEADKSFHVADGNIIKNMTEEFRSANIPVIHYDGGTVVKWTGGEGKTVIIITGHSDQQLKAFAEELGDAGYLKGNAVIFNSCGTELTDEIIREINTKYGALATFNYRGAVRAASVSDAMSSFVTELKQAFNASGSLNVADTIRRAVIRAKAIGLWIVCQGNDETFEAKNA